MTLIDMTSEIGSLLAALDILLVIAATAIAVSAWRHQSASLSAPGKSTAKPTVVGDSPSVPAFLQETPSDPSFPEAA